MATEMEIGNFHHRDGWFFKRMDDGTVRIQKRTNDAESRVEIEHFIDESSWASVVASVSAFGENGETHDAALDLHAGHSALAAIREFAQIAAAVYPDGSLRVSARMGRIPAQSFRALYRYAKRVSTPQSAFDDDEAGAPHSTQRESAGGE